MTAAACSEIAVQQPAVVVGVDRRFDVVDGDRADEPLVEHQRTDQRRLQRRLSARQAGRLEVGARPRVDERPAVARHPAGQALPVRIVSCWTMSDSTPVANRQRSVSDSSL